MQKRGKTAAGTQRWLCAFCVRSHALGHEAQKQGRLLDRFVSYLLGKQSQAELGVSDRTFREQTAWCWDIVPYPPVTGEYHSVLLVDGTRVAKQVCLVAANNTHALAWMWAPWESSTTWQPLLACTIRPRVIVCDGQKGIELAIARSWSGVAIQRCLFHVWMNIRKKLTLNPQSKAGQDLLAHYRTIWQVRTPAQADEWVYSFQKIYAEHSIFLKERTKHPNPTPGQRTWWYTHRDVRSAYRQIDKLITTERLFTYTNTDLQQEIQATIPRTTNFVEGGINSQLKELLRHHRGMPPAHQQRLAEWYLFSKTEGRKPPRFCL
jgi:hypothetical protein